MLRHAIQTAVWKYDMFATTIVALLPQSTHHLSVKLGRMTLPSIWAMLLIVISLINLQLGNIEWAMLGFLTILTIPIGSFIKLIFRRERPKTIYAQNMKIKSYSFPSSHAYSATVAGGYIVMLSLANLPNPFSYIIAALALLLIVSIGISRIHVGAHYPTDVTAGWLLGIAILSAILAV